MTLMKYEPWTLLEQMRREMQQAMDTRTGEGSSVATSDWCLRWISKRNRTAS